MEVALHNLVLCDDDVPCGPGHACPYLPERAARERAFLSDEIDPLTYHQLMERGYRRSGPVYYKPACASCSACIPIRVPVETFRPSRSQRRVWRRNQDLITTMDRPIPDVARHALFTRYLDAQHDDTMARSYEDFCAFLYESPIDTREISYRLGDALVGVGIVDMCPRSLSTVYFFFDPHHRNRSLGTYSALWEIDFARRHDMPYYYLGYYVRDARTMAYKARFRPHERLGPDGAWRRADDNDV